MTKEPETGADPLAQMPPQQVRRISVFVCLVVSGFLGAHSINAFVADALYLAPEDSTQSGSEGSAHPVSFAQTRYADDIRSSGLFLLPAAPQGGTAPGGPAGAPVRASLGAASKIRLIGIVMGDRQGVFAIVEELASKKQALYRMREQIPDLGEVADIQRDGIMIRQGNLEEWLELGMTEKPAGFGNNTTAPASTSSPQAAGAPIQKVVDRREVELAMNDLPKLMTQARAVPYMVNGAINGFRIDYMAPASFYERIGIQAGDVLQRVNGVDIRDPGTMLNLLQQLKNERVVKLDMVRNNHPSTITYELR
jgi:general secretion pathway protein C